MLESIINLLAIVGPTMKYICAFFLTSIISLALAGCNSNRRDPLGPGSSLLPGAGRANLVVTEDNKYQACQLIFEEMYSSYTKATSLVLFLYEPGSYARVIGHYNGHAAVTAINRVPSRSNMLYSPALGITYNHFSDSGKLYMDGTVDVKGSWQRANRKTVSSYMLLDGTAIFSGDFSGSITFIGFELALGGHGGVVDMLAMMEEPPTNNLPQVGTVVISSGEDSISFRPYLFDYAPPRGPGL